MSEDIFRTGHGETPRVQVQHLDEAECRRLLTEAPLARLALVDPDGRPQIYPVNIRVDGESLLIRSADDAKIDALRRHPDVVVEADGATLRVRWSVIVHGVAQITELDPAGEPAWGPDLSWYPGEKTRLVRVSTETITGRRFLMAAGAHPRATR